MRTVRDGVLWYRKRAWLLFRNDWAMISMWAAVVFGIFLIACSDADMTDSSAGVLWHNIGLDASYTEVTLRDGTRCAIFDGHSAGGIDCNWKNSD